jgi:hypothetical protein
LLDLNFILIVKVVAQFDFIPIFIIHLRIYIQSNKIKRMITKFAAALVTAFATAQTGTGITLSADGVEKTG